MILNWQDLKKTVQQSVFILRHLIQISGNNATPGGYQKHFNDAVF